MKGTTRLMVAGCLVGGLLISGCADTAPVEDPPDDDEVDLVAGEGRTGAVPAPADAEAYFIAPQDGDTVDSPVLIRFGLRGIGVAPVGVDIDRTGHHHLLINEPEVDWDAPLPDTDQILHFGGGDTETELELPPGEHTLQLVLGDWKHQPHDPPVTSEVITITVRE